MKKFTGWMVLLAILLSAGSIAYAQESRCVDNHRGVLHPENIAPNIQPAKYNRVGQYYINYAHPQNIWTAARLGNNTLVDWNLIHYPDLVSKKNNQGWTPLHYAAWADQRSTIELLLANGADPNLKTPKGNTALDLVLKKGYFWTAEILKAHGGNK